MQSAAGSWTVRASRSPGRMSRSIAGADEQVLEWRSETDAEGRFLWDGAPGDRVLIGIGKDGYKSADEVSVGPSDSEVVFTLDRGGALRIKGTVVDSETNRPIPTFSVVPGVMAGFRDLEPLVHQDVS